MIRTNANLDDETLRSEAVRVLIEALGYSDTARFLRRHVMVKGDSVAQKQGTIDYRSVDDIVKEIEVWKANQRK